MSQEQLEKFQRSWGAWARDEAAMALIGCGLAGRKQCQLCRNGQCHTFDRKSNESTAAIAGSTSDASMVSDGSSHASVPAKQLSDLHSGVGAKWDLARRR